MMGTTKKGLIRFACVGGATLNFGDEFAILGAPDPNASRPSVVMIPRRKEPTDSNREEITIASGKPVRGEYVVVRREENSDGGCYFEAVPAGILDADAFSKERAVVSGLGGVREQQLAPVRIVGDKVQLSPEKMVINYAYRLTYRGRPRVFVLNSSGEVEVYRSA